MTLDFHRLIDRLQPEPGGEPAVRHRTALVDAVNADGTVDLDFNGTTVSDVAVLDGSTLTVGDVAQVAVWKGDLLVLGRARTTPAGFLNLGVGPLLTISGGAITVTSSFHIVDTEGAAATDDLVTINGGALGDLLILRSFSTSRDVVLKDGTGTLALAGDCTLNFFVDSIVLFKAFSGSWIELSRSDNA